MSKNCLLKYKPWNQQPFEKFQKQVFRQVHSTIPSSWEIKNTPLAQRDAIS